MKSATFQPRCKRSCCECCKKVNLSAWAGRKLSVSMSASWLQPNRNLEAAVEDGSFRSDLYYRLNVFPLKLPLLRERKEDIPLLVHRFLNDLSKRLGKPLSGVSESSMRQLMEYGWPGNVRELMHVIERAAILARGPVVQVEDLVSPSTSRKKRPQGLERWRM